MEPAVPKARRSGLRVLIVAGRHVLAPDTDLAVLDLHLAAGQRPPDRADDVFPVPVHRHDGRAFRDPIALQNLDAQRLKEADQLRIQRGAPADHGVQPSAENGPYFPKEAAAHVEPDPLQAAVEAYCSSQFLQTALFSCGIEDFFMQRLEDQRDGHKDGRALFPKIHFDRPHALVEIQRAAAVQRSGDIGHHLKGMAQRQKREPHVRLRELHHLGDGADLGAHVPVRQQYAAGLSRRAGGEVHGGDGVRPELGKRFFLFPAQHPDEIMHFQQPEAGDRARKCRRGLAAALVIEQQAAVGEPQAVFQLLSLHAVVQRYDHPSGGEHGKEHGEPRRAARPEKRDMPRPVKAVQRGRRLFAEPVQLRPGHRRQFFVRAEKKLPVRKALCRVLDQTAQIGIFPESPCRAHNITHQNSRLLLFYRFCR